MPGSWRDASLQLTNPAGLQEDTVMSARRNLASAAAAVILAVAALFSSTAPAAAATTIFGSAAFTTWGTVICGTQPWSTEIDGIIHWRLHEVVLHGGVYWALSDVSAMVEINDPGLIRDDCRPYLMLRAFDLKNSSGTVVASDQTPSGSWSGYCVGYIYDTNYWTQANGCRVAPYYFKLTHPAGYIYYGASVLPYDGLGLAGNTGWKSLGG